MTETYPTAHAVAPSPDFSAKDDRTAVIRRRRRLLIIIGVILGFFLLGYIGFTIFKPRRHRHRNGDTGLHRYHREPRRGHDHGSAFQGRADRQKERPLGHHRSRGPMSLPSSRRKGSSGATRRLLKNARIDLVRYQNSYKVHAIPEQQLATQQATVDAGRGHREARSRAISPPRRSTSTTPASCRRSPDAWDCATSIPATS
jgi:hypothetical protein